MLTDIQLQTMALTYREICEHTDATPWVPLGNFMNDFFDNFAKRREELVQDCIEIPANVTPELQRWAVFCAASVEYLCVRYDLPCPAWVHDAAFTPLSVAWFFSPAAERNPRVRERYERETPEAFKRRNIYCGNKVYVSKREAAAALRLKLTA
ncbi:hypothetical protein [Ktedonospora formicarum]|uniref:Uncharacterized protein n=1 Tax=Ktedonospora formicarum TaxID=2778364 RepID=A0A8J3I3R0_9CHLR|nr:hypothetical protein [Ktedonospora formicarum]GHO46238.1 hypothetical protein KSX_44010 [Ktedonospora formicarum]